MRLGQAKILGWTTLILATLVVFLAWAPFTAAIFLIIFLLPAASLTIANGAFVVGVAAAFMCLFAFVTSPIPIAELFKLPFGLIWIGLTTLVFVLMRKL